MPSQRSACLQGAARGRAFPKNSWRLLGVCSCAAWGQGAGGNGGAKIRQSDGRNDALCLQRPERVEDIMIEHDALSAFAATGDTCFYSRLPLQSRFRNKSPVSRALKKNTFAESQAQTFLI